MTGRMLGKRLVMSRLASLMVALAGAVLLLFSPAPASALTCSATVSSINFGNVALLSSSPTDVTGTLSVTCTSIPALSVVKMCPSIGAGSGGAAGSTRRLVSGGSTLDYQLYQDASRTAAWGAVDNTGLGTVPPIIISALLGGSGTATVTIYARLFGSQVTAPAGSYRSDFTGNATLFSYEATLLGSANTCTGFVGTANVRPTFSVTATPQRTCNVAATALNFPITGILSRNITAQSQVTVTCTAQTSATIALDAGRNALSGVRRMTSAAGAFINYGLYRDAQRATVWGSGAQAVTSTGTGSSQQLPVYGLVPAQNTPAPGSYADTVVVTVTY